MKKVIFLIIGALVLSLSCKKATDEAIDCVVELLFTTISYTPNPNDSREITLSITYGGIFDVSVLWEFDDGTTETKSGTSVVHRYDSAGAYAVKANITLSGTDHSSCSTSKSKTINVE